MTQTVTTLDRLWQRRGARGHYAPEAEYEAWMLVHEASPSLYIDLLGAVHEMPGKPDCPAVCPPGGSNRLHRLMNSFLRRAAAPGRAGLSPSIPPVRAAVRHPEPDHA